MNEVYSSSRKEKSFLQITITYTCSVNLSDEINKMTKFIGLVSIA